MAISFRASTAWIAHTTTATSPSLVYPSGTTDGDRVYILATWKDYTITASVTNWTEVTEYADGAVTQGNGTGSMKVGAWYRDFTTGDAQPQVAFSSAPNISGICVLTFIKGGSETWDAPTFVTAPWPSSASQTVTVGNLFFGSNGAGSVVIGLLGFRDDSATMTRPTDGIGDDGSNGSLVWNGNHAEAPATHFNSTLGNDASGDAGYRLVTTDAGGGIGVRMTATIAAAETGALLAIAQSVAAGGAPAEDPLPYIGGGYYG